MRTHIKLLTATLTAALALCIATGAATASRSLSIEGGVTEPNGGVKLVLIGRVTFAESGSNFICNLTLTKTVSRVIPKIEGTLIGRVTNVVFDRPERCTGSTRPLGPIVLLRVTEPELWRIIYKQFLGRLPEITGLLFLLLNIQILLEFVFLGLNFRCLYENGRLPETIGLLAAVERRTIRELRTLERAESRGADLIAQLRGSASCPAKKEFQMSLTPTEVERIVLL